MRDVTLRDALDWVANGTFDVPFAERAKQADKLAQASGTLRAALLSGKIRITSQGQPFKLTEYCGIDWDANQISESGYFCAFPFTPLRSDIKVDAADLIREFPPAVDAPITPPRVQAQKRRPGASTLHDIAYFLWEKEQNLAAKDIVRILNSAVIQYPEFRDEQEPAKPTTVAKWLTDFKNGTYKPANTKRQIIKNFPGIFDKLRQAHK